MSQKRKHITLTLDKKKEILKHLEKGEKLVHLAKEYSVGRATIHHMKEKKDQIESFYKRGNELSTKVRKTMKSGEFPQVEDSLYAREKPTHTYFR